jgi:hypothetical protein
MSKRNKTIAVLVKGIVNSPNQIDAENLQYNLLGRGYRWDNQAGSTFIPLGKSWPAWTLLVDVETKKMVWSIGVSPIKEEAYHIIDLNLTTNTQEAIDTIINPPAPPKYEMIFDAPSGVRATIDIDAGVVDLVKFGGDQIGVSRKTIGDIARVFGLLDEANKVAETHEPVEKIEATVELIVVVKSLSVPLMMVTLLVLN